MTTTSRERRNKGMLTAARVRTRAWTGKLKGPPDDDGRPSFDPREKWIGLLFVAPVIIGLVVFLVIPIIMAGWVSLRDWSGLVPPSQSEFIGLDNYRELLIEDGIRRRDFATSIRNNLWYVIGVVPSQTIIAFLLAIVVNQKLLKGKGFFRTAYYFPSITSAIAITFIFQFLFLTNGLINAVLPFESINWLNNPNGLIHNALGVVGIEKAPQIMKDIEFLSLSLWEWIAGPSVAMTAIMILVTWTTIGTFMLIFLAGLQGISPAIEEAATIDGATGAQRFFRITLPLMRPTTFFVVTLGIIGTWQVFDQIYVATFGGPQKSTITPAFWTYFQTFANARAGFGAALAVILFFIIMFFDGIKRIFIKERVAE